MNLSIFNFKNKFIIHLILFISIGAFLCGYLASVSEYYTPSYPQANFKIRQLLNKTDSVEILAVGNSHTMALDFETLQYPGYCVAQGGNDLFEIEYQLKSLIPLLSNVHTVLFSISYFMFRFDNSAFPNNKAHFSKYEYKKFLEEFPEAKDTLEPFKGENTYGIWIDIEKIDDNIKNILGEKIYQRIRKQVSDRMEIRREYYSVIPSFRFVRNDVINFAISKFSPIIRQDHWKEVFYSFLSDKNSKKKDIISLNKKFEVDSYGQGIIGEFFHTYKNLDDLIIYTREVRVPRHLYLQTIMMRKHHNLIQDTYDSIVSSIKYLQNQNIHIIFYTPPYFHSYTECYDQKTINRMKQTMYTLEENLGVDYYDFSTDSEFIFNHDLFLDSDHMNKEGARAFSKKFRGKISKNIVNLK